MVVALILLYTHTFELYYLSVDTTGLGLLTKNGMTYKQYYLCFFLFQFKVARRMLSKSNFLLEDKITLYDF